MNKFIVAFAIIALTSGAKLSAIGYDDGDDVAVSYGLTNDDSTVQY